MEREVDYECEFQLDEYETSILPSGLTMDDDDLYVLPNGKYLPPGCYALENGELLLYEPHKLSPFADMLAACTEE